MLCSIVMASHTFIWPTQDYEYQELGHTLLQVTGMLVAVGGCAVVLARYFPSLPFFNRLVSEARALDHASRPTIARPGRRSEGYESLAFLIGETGRTTSPLRPTGKARFGNLLIDVTADRRVRRARHPGRSRRRPGAAGHRQASRQPDPLTGVGRAVPRLDCD